ncbi:MAG TPA: glutamate--tRNA ligase, partial [Xanthobacteraceae bacterium]|nr:glutamate--tRNA ligase [Xanthobacteraceae bacterium]
ALAAKIDFSKISHGAARFDPKDLGALTARTLHAMPFNEAKPRLSALGIDADAAFWHAVRGNLTRFDDAKLWWNIVHEPMDSALAASERGVGSKAAEHLPPAPWNAETWDKQNWDAWIGALKTATGRKGRELFHPLRIALTGRENGPELRALLPLIGRGRALKRLQGEKA